MHGKSSPWPPGSFQLAWEAFSRGDYGPRFTYYVVISESGPYTSAAKLREAAGPPEISQPRWVTKTTREAEVEDSEGEKIEICEIVPKQFNQVARTASEKRLVMWIDGKKRFAYIVGPPGSRSEEHGEDWASQKRGNHREIG